jgi:hypothetical protein
VALLSCHLANSGRLLPIQLWPDGICTRQECVNTPGATRPTLAPAAPLLKRALAAGATYLSWGFLLDVLCGPRGLVALQLVDQINNVIAVLGTQGE